MKIRNLLKMKKKEVKNVKNVILVLIAISLFIYPVLAEEMICPDEHICPEPGSNEFGLHVADMTKTCLQEHGGKMFGHCVSDMAR